MTLQATIDLYSIVPDETINTRLVKKMLEIETLAANIKQYGLLLPLSVRPAGNGKYKLIDGHRRHLALCLIHPEPDTCAVPVLIQEEADASKAHQMSLAANIMRVPLHPVDQFRAFTRMFEDGQEIEEIAAAFGITNKMVRQRMALGSVIQPVLDAYIEENLDLETVTLFANEPKEKQKAIWDQVKDGDMPRWRIQQMFDETTFGQDDPIVGFVGRDAYVAAGGTISEDLFGEEGERWTDTVLANKLASEKLAEMKQMLTDSGWSFAITEEESEIPRWNYRRLDPDRIEWGKEGDEARLAELEELRDGDDPDWEAIDAEEAEIDSRRTEVFSAEQKARSGVLITRDYELVYGLVLPGSSKKVQAVKPEAKKEEGMSAALTDDLNGLLTQTAQWELGTSPMALALLALTMIEDFEQYVPIGWPLAFAANQRFRPKADGYDRHIAETIAALKLPAEGFRERVLHLTFHGHQEQLFQVIGLLTGRMLTKQTNKAEIIELLAGEDGRVPGLMDNFNEFREEFFSRLSADQIIAALKEAKVAVPKGLKKKELVAYAVSSTAPTDWLPRELVYAEPKAKAKRKKAA